MNVIFLLNSTYPCYTGGRENWLYHVCEALCHRHRVAVISEQPTQDSERLKGRVGEISSNITMVHAPNLRNFPATAWLMHSYGNILNQEVVVRSMWRRLKRILREFHGEPVFVISMDTVFTGQLGLRAKKAFPNVIFINSVRGPHAEIESRQFPLLKWYFYARERQTLSGADRIWSNGADTRDMLAKEGFSSVVMRNGVDAGRAHNQVPVPPQYVPANTDLNLITIGTLLDIKGYPELIRAVSLLKERYQIRLGVTALGKGDPAGYLTLSKELGVEDQICFAGHQSQTVEYAARFDLAACLSGGSGLSMACLESMLSGTTVIAWDSAVYQQMISHRESGYLVTPWDAEALAGGIAWLWQHPEERRQMGKAAQEKAMKFDWRQIAQHMEKEWEELLHENVSAGSGS